MLRLAAEIIQILVVARKSTRAIHELSKQSWQGEATNRATALEIALRCREAIGCQDVIIWQVEEGQQGSNLVTLASTAGQQPLDMPIGTGLAGRCATGSQVIEIDDLLDDEEVRKIAPGGSRHPAAVLDKGWRSAMFVPLDIGGEIVGVLGVYISRPFGWNELDRHIAQAFAERLCAGYVHMRRLEQLTDLERRVALEAPAMEAAMLAMERVHDANNSLVFAQDRLSEIAGLFTHEKRSRVYRSAIEASGHVRKAYSLTKRLADYATTKSYHFKECSLRQIY